MRKRLAGECEALQSATAKRNCLGSRLGPAGMAVVVIACITISYMLSYVIWTRCFSPRVAAPTTAGERVFFCFVERSGSGSNRTIENAAYTAFYPLLLLDYHSGGWIYGKWVWWDHRQMRRPVDLEQLGAFPRK